MYLIKQTTKDNINQMTKDYYNNLTAPMDDMWEEAIIPSGTYYFVSEEEITHGYFVLDVENNIVAFYVKDKAIAKEVFEFVIKEKEITKAYAASMDPLFYNECMDLMKSISDNTLLYILDETISVKAPTTIIEKIEAEIDDLNKVVNYFKESIGMQGKWLEYYFSNLITNKSLRLFKIDGKIIGTGEIRPSKTTKGYAHVGMTVAMDYRRKGIASYIISEVGKEAINKGYKAICSTTVDNIGSQKTLEKCGYQCHHKIYNILF